MRYLPAYLFFLFLVPSISLAQDLNKFLVLENLNNSKRIKYYVNDQITLELKNQTRISGSINKIKDSTIIVENTEFPLSEVRTVFVSRSNFVTHAFTFLFAGCGIGFVTIDSFNNLINNDTPVVNKQALIAGAALVSTAGLIKLVSRKKYKINGEKVLRIINTSPV